MKEPSDLTLEQMRVFVEKYREKTGTFAHPDPEVPASVIKGLAAHRELLGKPLCPCNFYPDKAHEATSRRWICACDEMKRWKYCHCLLFVRQDGLPITEYLPEDHEGRQTYGRVADETPDRGREARDRPPSPPPAPREPTAD